MDIHLVDYIFEYHSHLLNDKEADARDHFNGARSRMTNDERISMRKERYQTNDPEALELLKDGWTQFVINTSTRIYNEHRDHLWLNCCYKCGKIARTPRAQQCRACGNTWQLLPTADPHVYITKAKKKD